MLTLERQVKVCSCLSFVHSQALFIVTWTLIPSFLFRKHRKACTAPNIQQSCGTASEWLVHSQQLAHHSAANKTESYPGKHDIYEEIVLKYSQSLQTSLLHGLPVMTDLLIGSSSFLSSEKPEELSCSKKLKYCHAQVNIKLETSSTGPANSKLQKAGVKIFLKENNTINEKG